MENKIKFYCKRSPLQYFNWNRAGNPKYIANFYEKCWSFLCGNSNLVIKSGSDIKYNNRESKSLNNGDIIEVIVDRKLGNLSF